MTGNDNRATSVNLIFPHGYIPGHFPSWIIPLPFYIVWDILPFDHPPVCNIKRSTVNVGRLGSGVWVSASFHIFTLTAVRMSWWGGKLSERGNVRGGNTGGMSYSPVGDRAQRAGSVPPVVSCGGDDVARPSNDPINRSPIERCRFDISSYAVYSTSPLWRAVSVSVCSSFDTVQPIAEGGSTYNTSDSPTAEQTLESTALAQLHVLRMCGMQWWANANDYLTEIMIKSHVMIWFDYWKIWFECTWFDLDLIWIYHDLICDLNN